MIENEDNNIVHSILKGNSNSFGILLDKYQRVVYNLALRMTGNCDDSKELTQIVFIKIYNNLGSFDFRFKFYSWMYRIALNEIINFIKSKRTSETITTLIRDESNPERELIETEKQEKIYSALSDLKEDYRELIELKYYEGLSYNEIAEVVGISEKKVKSRLFTAREYLKNLLIKYEAI